MVGRLPEAFGECVRFMRLRSNLMTLSQIFAAGHHNQTVILDAARLVEAVGQSVPVDYEESLSGQ